ncbi:MAG: hypothetical protein V4586_04195 [Pseudomonadota bacterium]
MRGVTISHQQQFVSICENGLGFVSKAIEQLWDDRAPDALKYSVINFYSGVELLLKARLMREHWSLVVADPSKADIDKFLNGEAQTVGLEQAVQRLKNIAKVTVHANAVNSFDELRKHRNRMVHFYHPIDGINPDRDRQRDAVVLEQCRGWFYLRRLLGDEWSDVFAAFQVRIADINMSMKPHLEYLRTVYEQIRPELEIEKRNGAFLATCSACGFEAHVLDDIGPQEARCRVCLSEESLLLHKCSNVHCEQKTLLPEGEYETWVCSHCDNSVELAELLTEYTIEGKAGRDDPQYPALCTECSQETAATLDDGATVFCFNCFSWPEKIEFCEWCNAPFTGDAEHTYWSGCERCDGKSGSMRDD